MPFDDLTETQKTFITTYFKTGGRRKKTKQNNEDFNAQLARTLASFYEKLNTCEALIARLEAAEAEAPEDSAKVPIGLYQNYHAEQIRRIEGVLSANRKLLKQRIIPDFGTLKSDLDGFELRLNAQLERINSGARADNVTDAEKLRYEKEQCASACQDRLDTLLARTQTAYGAAKKKMARAQYEHIAERDAKIKDYSALHSRAGQEIGKLLADEGEDQDIAAVTFEGHCGAVLAAFERDGDVLHDRIVALGDMPDATQEALTALKASADFKDLATVKISDQRDQSLSAELAKLSGTDDDPNSGAIAAQHRKLEDLRAEYRAADDSKKAGLKKQFDALNAQIEKLEARKEQLKAYADAQLARDRQIVESAQNAKRADLEANALADALTDEDADINALGFEWLDRPVNGVDADVILAQIIEYRATVEAAGNRDMYIEKLSPDEPTPKELSAEECATLQSMLDSAEVLANEGQVDLAEKIYAQVRDLKFSFMQARAALSLPPLAQVPPSPAKALIAQAELIRSDANDLWGQGLEAAADIAEAADNLVPVIKADEVNGLFIATPDLHKDTLKGLRDQVAQLQSTVAPTEIPPEKVKAAQDTANQVSAFLDDALKTKPLKDTDIIQEPGVAYPEQAQKHLVPRENLIMVEVDGEMVQHKIETKVGKGAEEHASRARGTKVPVDVLEAMVARNHALRAMTEVDTPGGEQMLADFQKEAEDWLTDVKDNGDKLYPELKKLISDCEKIFKKGEVATYVPDTYGTVKTAFDAFKDSYTNQMPTKAKAEGDTIKSDVDDLEKEAKDTVKPLYESTKALYDKLVASLSGKKKKGEEAPLGKFMEAFLAKTPEEVFGSVKGLSEDGAAEIAKARDRFVKLQEFYKSNKGKVEPKQVDGPWMDKIKLANKSLETKVYSNITEAKDSLEHVRDEIKDYQDGLSGMDALAGDDLAKKIAEICKTLADSAVSATKAWNTRADFLKKLDALKDDLKSTAKGLKKLGKNPVAETLKTQADALDARRKAADSKVQGDEDYDSGLSELEDIETELSEIKENMAGLDPSARVKIKHIRIGERLTTLQTTLDKLTTRASELAAKDIRPKMSEEQVTALATQVGVVDAGLKKVTGVISLAGLKTITDDIDAKNDDEAKSWKAERVALRERALKEIRSVRSKLETHPAAQLYAENPFDGGANTRLVLSALQHVEIAVLSCVSPKDPE